MKQNTKWNATKHEMAGNKTRDSMKQNTKWHATKQEMTQQKKRISFTDALSFIVIRCD